MKPFGLLYCLRCLWTWRCAAISSPTFLSFWSYINWPTSNWFMLTQFLSKRQRIALDDYLVLGPCRSRLAKTKGFLLRSSSTYGRENVEWKRNKTISIFCSSARKKSCMCLSSLFLLYLELNWNTKDCCSSCMTRAHPCIWLTSFSSSCWLTTDLTPWVPRTQGKLKKTSSLIP